MVSVIADILMNKLTDFPWINDAGRIAGLVQIAQRPDVKVDPSTGEQTIIGYKTAPIACNVNLNDCWDKKLYKTLEPDSGKSVVAFFVDQDGTRFVGNEGERLRFIRFRFGIKLVMWLNLIKLGEDVTGNYCQPSGRIAPYIMSKLWGDHSAVGMFDGGIEESIFQGIKVTDVTEMPKSTNIFNPFSFATDGDKRALFLYPYDYLGIQIRGEFVVNKDCLPEFASGWVPSGGCISWDNVIGVNGGAGLTLCQRFFRVLDGIAEYESAQDGLMEIFACLDELPVFDNNEDGLAGGFDPGGPYVYYVASANNVQYGEGLLVRLRKP